MTAITFSFNETTKRYEHLANLNGPMRLRIKNSDLRGIVALDVYTLDGEGDEPCLVKRLTSYHRLMDKVISFDGYPCMIKLSLTFNPAMAEMDFVSDGGSSGGGSIDNSQLNALVSSIEEQKRINERQQIQIDENKKVNDDQQALIDDNHLEEATESNIAAMFPSDNVE